MATSYKVLGQVAPAATTATTLYTVPSATQTVVSTIWVANGGAAGSYRIAIRPAGATLEQKHYIAKDIALAANSTTAYTNGLTLGAGDVVTVYASSADFSFNLSGSEIA